MKELVSIRRMFILLCVVIVTGGYCRWGVSGNREVASAQRNKHATLSIENTVHDFGKIDRGEKPVATFVFRNTGNDVLKIHEVSADNQNVTTVLSHESLNPGEQGTIKVTLDSTRLHGDVVSYIAVRTNDGDQPEIFLEVSAQVQPVLALVPPFVFVGQVAKEGSFSGKVNVIGRLVQEGKLKAITIHTSSPAIEARIRRRGAKHAVLEFVLKPEQKAGTFEESITLMSKDPPAQTQVVLYGQKLGIIRFTPDRLEFFPRGGVRPDSRSVLFECDKRFNITRVEDLSGLLILSIRAVEEGRKYELTGRLKNPMEEGSFLGVVRVYTDLAEHSLIHIPVIGGEG